ncbi:hypothetical protein Tco_0765595 [Tanacetum coccineum]
METQKPLLKDENGEEVDVHMYRSMIGSLMYLTSSRPDIMFAVCVCARYQVNTKVSHLYAMEMIFRYLKGQPKLGLWYPNDSPFDLVSYTDSDYARASLDRNSTTRGCQFLGCRLISWQCKKQIVVANSTIEADHDLSLYKEIIDIAKSTDESRIVKDGVNAIIKKQHGVFLNSRSYAVGDLKSRGSIEDFVSFREMITSQLQGKLWLYDESLVQVVVESALDSEITLDYGPKTTALNAFSGHYDSAIICLAINQNSHDVNVSTGEEVFATIVDDITLAQVLKEMKSTKPKKKGVVIQELAYEQERSNQAFDEEERLAREKAEKEEVANIALIETWDDIQAKIDDDHQLAKRMQAQEQEELSIEEKATLFQQLLEKRRKHFAAKRAEEKRNKPPTKSQ